jgi:hypothetical protein
MGVKVSFEITSPIDAEDRELLTGLSMMTLAIANHELAKGFPQQEEPQPCGALGTEVGTFCISEVGHKGRHRFRSLEQEGAMN